VLHRDVHDVCTWFVHRGVDNDPEAWSAELVAAAFSGGHR